MIEIICVKGAGDKEMDTIKDNLLTSEEMAIRRGTYEIYKQWYLVHNQTIQTPFKFSDSGYFLEDDDIVEISDALFGISGNRKINKVSISGNTSDVSMQLDISKYVEFI